MFEVYRGHRFMMSGTSALPKPLRNKWYDLTGEKRILERYGASEFSTGILTPLRNSDLVPDVSYRNCPASAWVTNYFRAPWELFSQVVTSTFLMEMKARFL
jgi:hypothetical protein